MTTDHSVTAKPIKVSPRGRLPLPPGVVLNRGDWPVAASILIYHFLALLAFTPWSFSWTRLIVSIVTARLTGLLGINICYHRLLTHRGFKSPKWFEHVLAVVAVC